MLSIPITIQELRELIHSRKVRAAQFNAQDLNDEALKEIDRASDLASFLDGLSYDTTD